MLSKAKINMHYFRLYDDPHLSKLTISNGLTTQYQGT
uniref:Uncharacterized protein n=1 Tax=Arundo donax TaxID=35708 RepID=A0A0A9C089_ARUDO